MKIGSLLKGIVITFVVLLILFAAVGNQHGLHQLATIAKNLWDGAAYLLRKL